MIKKSLLLFWHFHRKLFIGLLVLLAIILIVLRSLAFYLESNPHILEVLVESQLKSQVTFGTINVNVNPLYPAVSMQDFVIENVNDERNFLKLSSAKIQFNIPLSIFRGQLLIDTLELDGASLLIKRTGNGDILIADLNLSNQRKNTGHSANDLESNINFFNQINFILTKSEISFHDEMQEYPDIFFTDINFEIKNYDERHQVLLKARLNDSDTDVDFRLDFNGRIDDIRNWDGKIYGDLDNLNHQTILNFLNVDELQIENFQINDIETSATIWSSIESGNLQSIHGNLLVNNARLKRVDREQSVQFNRLSTNFILQRINSLESSNKSLEKDKKSIEPQQKTPELKTRNSELAGNNSLADLSQESAGWSIDLYDLNLRLDSKPITGKHINLKYTHKVNEQPSRVQVYLNEIDLENVSHVASVLSPIKLNRQINSILKPRGQIENVILSMTLNSLAMPIDISDYQIQAGVKNFSVNAFQSLPKIRNLTAQLQINESMGNVTIDSRDLSLHVKSLFRDSWPVDRLTGDIYWQKEGTDWLLGTENLVVKSPHLTANADLKLWFLDSGKIFMDLTGFYHDANVEYTSYYLPVTIMSEGLVQWLDEAIISGWGTDGGVVYRGDLSQFPYQDHSGVLDIVFNTKDVVLEYEKDWPKLTDIKGQVQFTEQGMKVEAQQSKIFSAVSDNIQADIEYYLAPDLRIKGDIKSNVDDALLFLKQSELLDKDDLDILHAKGHIGINLDLFLPLEPGKPDTKVKISLRNIDYFPPGFDRKNRLVSNLNGVVNVRNQFVSARKLTADIMQHPAEIVIKSTKHPDKSKQDPLVNIFIDSQFSVEQLAKFNLLPLWSSSVKNQYDGIGKFNLKIDLPNQHQALSFKLSSDLKGIKADLPPPFAKQAKESTPLKISYSQLMTSGRTTKKAQTARLNIDYSDFWSIALLLDTSTESFDLLKGNIDLEGGQASLPKQNKLTITGSIIKIPLDQWQNFFSSQPKSSNILQVTAVEKPFIPVELALTEVVLPELQFDPESKQKPVKESKSNLNPVSFPLLNGSIESLKMGKAELGKFTISSSRMKQGINYDLLDINGKLMSFKGNAMWSQVNMKSKVELQGKIKVPSVELFSKELGFEQLMRNGKGESELSINWAGAPNDLNKKSVAGKVSFEVEKGAYLEGNPGAAGRIMGLLNMNALARRIRLDFTDVSKKGFDFDKIQGDFQLSEGNAYTDNFRILAPSTKILVTGRTGMVAEDFDQRVTVIPDVSATLPLAGAAVAGPAGAAVVWIGQKILGEQLNKVTAYGYTVKGGWDAPIIEREKASKKTIKNVEKLLGSDILKDQQVDAKDNNPVFDSN